MRILIVSTAALRCPPDSYGGIEFIAWLLGDALSQKGHDITIAAVKGSRPPNPNVKIIETVDIDAGQGYQENTALEFYGPKIKDYDLVNDHSHSKFASFYIKDNDLKVAYLPTVHNMGTIAYPIRKPSIVCLSQTQANYVEKRHGYKCKYVHNGLRVSDFRPIIKRKLKSDRYFICGRPNSEKNLLEAIDICKKANVPCDVVAGRLSVEPTDYVLKVAQACLFGSPWAYRGQLSHEDKNKIMARAKATLITYGGRDSRGWYVEPFGLVAAESLLVGTPVIGYDCGAFKEIVRHGIDGFVIPRPNFDEKSEVEQTHEAFIKAMKEVDSLDLEEIRFSAAQRFSHTRMGQDYEKLFEEKLRGEAW